MDKFVVRGGNPLLGTVRISGAKNAALPAMAAALLTEEPVILENIPQVRDIETERRLLAAMGAEVELGYGRAQHRTTICCRQLARRKPPTTWSRPCAPPRSCSARWSRAWDRARLRSPVAAPSARVQSTCTSKAWNSWARRSAGTRLHRSARRTPARRKIVFDKITVTGTEDLLMAAVLAEGETVLENCAREPEVVDLADLLNKMGASIEGAGTHTIRVQGVEAARRASSHHPRPHRSRRPSSLPARSPEATSWSPTATATWQRCLQN